MVIGEKFMQDRKRKFRKADMILVAGILLLAVLSFAVIELFLKQPGASVVVTADGKVYGVYALNSSQQIVVETAHGKNVLQIEAGKVYMTEADCPDKICVKTGKISRTGETIVCLPHKVVVEVQAQKESLDGVVQ